MKSDEKLDCRSHTARANNPRIAAAHANPGRPDTRFRTVFQAVNSPPFECGKSVQSDYMEIARAMPLFDGLANHLHVFVNQAVMRLRTVAGVPLGGNKFLPHVSNCYIL